LKPLKVDLGKGSLERGLSNMREAIVVGQERILQTSNREAIVIATMPVIGGERLQRMDAPRGHLDTGPPRGEQ